MNEMDQILMREHHLENETLSLKARVYSLSCCFRNRPGISLSAIWQN